MIETASKKVTSFFIEKGIIEESKRAMCEYSLYTRMLSCITSLFMYTIAIPTLGIVKSILLIKSVLDLRKRTGGFHADSEFKCFCISNIMILLLSWYLFPLASRLHNIKLVFSYIIYIVFIAIIAPINHYNNILTIEEITANKRKINKILSVLSFLFVLGIMFESMKDYAVIINLVVFTVMLSILLAKILHQEAH